MVFASSVWSFENGKTVSESSNEFAFVLFALLIDRKKNKKEEEEKKKRMTKNFHYFSSKNIAN